MKIKNKLLCCLYITMALILLVGLSACDKACKHTFSSEIRSYPTCTADGLTVHSCMSCDFTYDEVVPAKGGHQAGNPTEENRIEASCTDGSYDSVVRCTACGTELQRESIAIPGTSTGHVTVNGACIKCGLPESSGGLVFRLNSDKKSYTLDDIGTCVETDIVIGLYNNMPVTVIEHLAFDDDAIRTVTVADCVLEIQAYAFNECEKLTSVTVGSGVREIDPNAFYGSLKIRELTVSDDNPVYKSVDNNLYSRDGKTLFWYAPGRKDTSFTVPDGVTEIGERAFWRTPRLVDVTIPDGVTVIGEQAFYECITLESVSIPDGILEIGNSAFAICTSLKGIVISGGSIAAGAFARCTSLASVTLADGVTDIGNSAFFGCTALTEITIPASVITLGLCPFNACTGITGVNVDGDNPAYMSLDGNLYTVDGKTLIWYAIGKPDTHFTIPVGVEKIEVYAFSYSPTLVGISIPGSVTEIGEVAFAGASALAEIDIPVGVTKIGASMFSGCTSLVRVSIPDGVTEIGECAFGDCTSLEIVIIPDSVTVLGRCAFCDCYSLKSVVIGDGVPLIKSDTFYNCVALTDVVIGNGVTEIDERAFYRCEGLKNLTLGANIVTIHSWSFYGCASLESLVIPDKVTSIGHRAFDGCTSLKNLVLPASIKTLTYAAFDYAPNLTTIKYRGTQEQWNAIAEDIEGAWYYDLTEYEIIFGYTDAV